VHRHWIRKDEKEDLAQPTPSHSSARRRRLQREFQGFISGSIYTGNLKTICVPVLNCYSCPALLAPVRSAAYKQSRAARSSISAFTCSDSSLCSGYYSVVSSADICALSSAAGSLTQNSDAEIKVPAKLNRILSFGKYVMLIGVVMLLPFIARNSFGMSDPYFCKYVCPAGTIGGGIPLVVLNPAMREAAGSLFIWKVTLAIAILVLSVFLYRVFCRYLCPLGAFYGSYSLSVSTDSKSTTNASTAENARASVKWASIPSRRRTAPNASAVATASTNARQAPSRVASVSNLQQII